MCGALACRLIHDALIWVAWRPGRAQTALMWTHLIKVPLAVRAAGPTDIPALLRLQDASLSNLRV